MGGSRDGFERMGGHGQRREFGAAGFQGLGFRVLGFRRFRVGVRFGAVPSGKKDPAQPDKAQLHLCS